MDWIYLVYFLLGVLVFFGARPMGRGEWNDAVSLEQTKALQGAAALGVALHHMAQKTCAPWLARTNIVRGLEPFLPAGYMVVGVFLFCSGLGLYRSLKTKPDYLKGFFRRRVLPVVIAFYLSEFIYTAVRLLMGERMDFGRILGYLSGFHMANFNAWYAIAIPFFYLAFWAAFRFCRRDGTAIFWVFVFTLGYAALGAALGRRDDGWMRGEWWYDSILLFPLGLLFARFEGKILKALKKGWVFWLVFFTAGFFLLFRQSEWLLTHRLGYFTYGPLPKMMADRLLSAGTQWLVALFFVMACLTLMLKVRLGNRALAWLGAASLDFYLMHGMFVEFFGFGFLEISRSLVYIRNVPLYIAAVLGCSVPAAMLFRWIRLRLTGLLTRKRKAEPRAAEGEAAPESQALARARKKAAGPRKAVRILRTWFWPVAGVLLAAVIFLMSRQGADRAVGRVVFRPPDGFTVSSRDSRYTVWKYSGEDKKVSTLVLDTGIRGDNGQLFATVEEVLESCGWMTEGEIYVNPQGIRMARGFSMEGDSPMRRYYVETGEAVAMLSMRENESYYDPAACEEAILQAADRVTGK